MVISDTTVQAIVNRIVEKFQPFKVIVFGSWAAGKAGQDSDLDFMVVIDCAQAQKRDLQVAIRKELRDIPVPKDILVATPDDIKKYEDAWWTVYQPAMEKGKVLYEQQGAGARG